MRFVGKIAQILFDLPVVVLGHAILGRLADGIAVAGGQIEILAGAGHIGSRAGIRNAAAVGIGAIARAAAHVLFIGHAGLLIGIGLLAGLTRLARLARLSGLLARLSGLTRLSRLSRLAGLTRLARLTLLGAGLSGVQ